MIDADFLRRKRVAVAAVRPPASAEPRRKNTDHDGRTGGRVIILVGRRVVGGGGAGATRRGFPFGKSGTITPVPPCEGAQRARGRGVRASEFLTRKSVGICMNWNCFPKSYRFFHQN